MWGQSRPWARVSAYPSWGRETFVNLLYAIRPLEIYTILNLFVGAFQRRGHTSGGTREFAQVDRYGIIACSNYVGDECNERKATSCNFDRWMECTYYPGLWSVSSLLSIGL